MFRSSTGVSVVAGIVALCAAGSPVSAQASWQIYDLRDLIPMLPRDPMAEDFDLERGENVDALLGSLCTAMAVECTPLVPGIFAIEAEADEHARVATMLEAVRALYREQFVVELIVYRTPADRAPAIGSPPAIPESSNRMHFVVPRRTPVPVMVTSQRAYVSDVSAVVATSAVAYEPQTASVDEGLDLSLVVGAGPDSDTRTSVDLLGSVRRATWAEPTGELAIPEVGPVRIELPILSVRSVRSHVELEFGKPAVVAVATGFGDNECIVMAMTVKK
jgi:hypothetical protein